MTNSFLWIIKRIFNILPRRHIVSMILKSTFIMVAFFENLSSLLVSGPYVKFRIIPQMFLHRVCWYYWL
jgi:hypothetical protein